MFGEAMMWYLESVWALWRGMAGGGMLPLLLLCFAIWLIFCRRGGCCCCRCRCRCGGGDGADADD